MNSAQALSLYQYFRQITSDDELARHIVEHVEGLAENAFEEKK